MLCGAVLPEEGGGDGHGEETGDDDDDDDGRVAEGHFMEVGKSWAYLLWWWWWWWWPLAAVP